jgi:DNA-binding MarR family transcriptional regulator
MTDEIPLEATLAVRDACLCLHTRRAARALSRRFDDAFRPLGLTNGQFSLMAGLNLPEPRPMQPVARLLGMDRTSLTAMLKPLEARGLVSIDVDPDDARSRRIGLTRRGRQLLARALPIWQRTHAHLERELAAGVPDRLREGLRSIESTVAAPPSRANTRARRAETGREVT